MSLVHNFSAGPSALPVPVRERLVDALAVSPDGQPSVAEISHRGKRFMDIAKELEERLRRLMDVGEEHAVVLMQGGANLQFAMLPMNFARGRRAAYLISGHWGQKALAEASLVTETIVAGDSQAQNFISLPIIADLPDDCAYLHFTGNETIHGVQFKAPPDVLIPLAADLSSEFLSRPYPYANLGFAYAGAQKNLGIAGLTVVLVRRDLLDQIPANLPRFLDYRTWVNGESMYNTPATLAWYVALETLRWIDDNGGLKGMAERNRAKAAALYAAIDGSDFYSNPVSEPARSVMNVPFWTVDESLVGPFVEQAEAAGLQGLKGHRALGGLRASLYNALSLDSVEALIQFMHDFERRYG